MKNRNNGRSARCAPAIPVAGGSIYHDLRRFGLSRRRVFDRSFEGSYSRPLIESSRRRDVLERAERRPVRCSRRRPPRARDATQDFVAKRTKTRCDGSDNGGGVRSFALTAGERRKCCPRYYANGGCDDRSFSGVSGAVAIRTSWYACTTGRDEVTCESTPTVRENRVHYR